MSGMLQRVRRAALAAGVDRDFSDDCQRHWRARGSTSSPGAPARRAANPAKAAGRLLALAAAMLALGSTPALAAPAEAPDATVAHADYGNPALWLCRPDLAVNRCHVNIDATVIAADGSSTIEHYQPAKDPGFDCFFVYPTVSKDPGWQSDFVPDHMEFDDIRQQFARFGEVCRQYAPVYRQHTLTALRRNAGGPQPVGDPPPAGFGGYTDVLDAWNWYLQHANNGRNVVLIGHSQGAAMVMRLLAEEVDGKPIQKRLISALVIGAPVLVPAGRDVGGTFKTIPLCHSDRQTGCVITYATFRDRFPPAADSFFGRARDGLRAACTNPANLAGGVGVADSYFPTSGSLNDAGGDAHPQWTTPERAITTPFVKTPGMVTLQCVTRGDFDYLQLHVNPNPGGGRTDQLGGEIVRPTGVDYRWGLHILDMHQAMGNLIRIVSTQAQVAAGQN